MFSGLVVVAAVIAVMVFGTTAALAASPRQIYSDLANNGKLDSTYNAADLQNAALDASVQGYGGIEVVTLRPVVQQAGVAGTQKTVVKPTPAAGVAGVQKTRTAAPLAATQAAGTLPFTGLQVGTFVAIGLALLGAGLLLRRTTRAKDSI
jgi:hypothetical protein